MPHAERGHEVFVAAATDKHVKFIVDSDLRMKQKKFGATVYGREVLAIVGYAARLPGSR